MSLNDERKDLYQAVENEHRLIMAGRMKKLVSGKIRDTAATEEQQKPGGTEESKFFNPDKTLEVNNTFCLGPKVR